MNSSGKHSESSPLPENPSAEPLLLEGLSAFYREHDKRALELFEDALRVAPDNLRAHYLVALCAHLLTQEETLEQTCSHALKLNPRDPYTIACEAVRYLYLSNFSRAKSLFEKALQMLPRNLDLKIGLGILYEYSGDKEHGIDIFGQALELDPENVRVHVALGAFCAMSGDFDAALAEYRIAKGFEPSLESPHQRLGQDYYYEGMVEQAASEFGRAIHEEPKEPAGYFYLLDCLRRLGRTDSALDVYEEIRKEFGGNPGLTSGLYEQFSMCSEAIGALEQLSESKPSDPSVLLRLSMAYRDADRLSDAIDMAEKLTRLAPDDYRCPALLGELYFRHEDYRLAVAFCRRAVKLNPNAQSAYTTLADALLFLGRQEESYQAIQEMEHVRKEAWKRYQAKFSGQDRADAGL